MEETDYQPHLKESDILLYCITVCNGVTATTSTIMVAASAAATSSNSSNSGRPTQAT
jgi:hypothetical protein